MINAGGYGLQPNYGKEGDKLIKVHFNGLINLLKVLHISEIKKFIQIGSSSEYGKANSPYKETHFCRSNSLFLC